MEQSKIIDTLETYQLAAHGDGEPPKTLDVGYVENIKHYFDNPNKSPFNLIMGDTLDQ